MNIENVQNLRQPPYFRNAAQKGPAVYQASDDSPGDAQKSIGRFEREVMLYHDGEWHVDTNMEGQPGYDDGAVVISGSHYDPDFRVRAFKLYNGNANLFAVLVYDLPWSSKVVSPWACGVTISGQITRLWTGDNSMTQGTRDTPFFVSLLG